MLGDTLTNNFSHDEIETVLAHELGRHVHNDLPLGIIVQSVITLAGFWLANLIMRWGIETFNYSGLADADPPAWVEFILHSHPRGSSMTCAKSHPLL